MGASALYQLAKRGSRVLGLEQFNIVHDKGSHSGHTRIIRKAYFEHLNYVPLLESAYRGWDELELLRGETIFHKTGLTYLGEPDHPVMTGVKSSAEQYGIPLDYDESSKKQSIFNLPSAYEIFHEPEAGFVLVEPVIRAYVEEAEKLGAEVQTDEVVLGWRVNDEYIEVHTSKMEYHAQKLVLTAGAYLKYLVPSISDKLTVTRQLIGWVKPQNPGRFTMQQFPCWVMAVKDHPGIYYGFPILMPERNGGNGLLKIAHHTPGTPIDPFELKTDVSKDQIDNLLRFMEHYLTEAHGQLLQTELCMYTNTPDEHFIIDFLPESGQKIILATGFSGHGFKFVPVIGEILADMARDGRTGHPVNFLRLDRFSE